MNYEDFFKEKSDYQIKMVCYDVETYIGIEELYQAFKDRHRAETTQLGTEGDKLPTPGIEGAHPAG